MPHVDALKIAEHLRERLVDLAVSENYVRDKALAEACRRLWSEEAARDAELVSELWVEGAFPGLKVSDTLDSLAETGMFPASLRDHIVQSNMFPSDRLLFNHQSEALHAAHCTETSEDRPTLVITAGTGLGKTEAFLLPVLADLWTAPKRCPKGGMRALILYPMNALIADQIERLYGWLKDQKRLSLFHFTGETPEDAHKANSVREPTWTQCRRRTRQEARGLETHSGEEIKIEALKPVPDIIVTNYSMLEYMLCRPQDACFFGPDLRCIVLDEAHLYTGMLAAEIALLLRRVTQRCGVSANHVLKIATSATLGGGDEDLRRFAADLFSVGQDRVFVIRGRRGDLDLGGRESPPSRMPTAGEISALPDPNAATLTAENELKTCTPEIVAALKPTAALLVAPEVVQEACTTHSDTPARFLHAALREAPLVRQMAQILADEKGTVISLAHLSERLFPNDAAHEGRSAVIRLLRLTAAARLHPSDLPLVPHRLHLLVRAPEGVSVCLNPQCNGPDYLKIASLGAVQAHADRCRHCNHVLLPIHRCNNCGEWALAAYENQETSCLGPGYYAPKPAMRIFYLIARPINVKAEDGVEGEEHWINSENGKVGGCGDRGVPLWAPYRHTDDHRQQCCPVCLSDWTIDADEMLSLDWKDTCKPLKGGRSFALSVIAETILHNLPPLEAASRAWKPAEGRRLLCFSDSRASAASLGPKLTLQHEIQVVRSAIARSAEQAPDSAEARLYLEKELCRLSLELRSAASPDLTRILEGKLRATEKDLEQMVAGIPFPDFARRVASRPEIRQVLERDPADDHSALSYGQTDWEKNENNAKHHAEALVARELDHPIKRQVSVEAVGLVEITYPGLDGLPLPPAFEERLGADDRRQRLGETWPDIAALLLDTVRLDRCVDWSQQSGGRTWLGVSPLEGRWLTRDTGGWRARAFVGKTSSQSRRRFAANVLETVGYTKEAASSLSEHMLSALFDQLYESAGTSLKWLALKETHEVAHEQADRAIQILFDQLSLRRPQQLFLCPTTHTIWTRCALAWVPLEGCQGNVQDTTHTQLDDDPRWGRPRREILTSPVFTQGLWAEEHSAQLDPRENRRLQDLFKEGIRNVLSSTTTMELGIDIGGLNGVLLANVPPGPANHRQRAGRAGRRSDGSAIVVTYARDSEFDRHVFARFGDFLKRPLRKPVVFLQRERVVKRHLYAVLRSHFLRPAQPNRVGATHAFGKMGSFCGLTPPPKWMRALQKPSWPSTNGSKATDFLGFLSGLQENPSGHDLLLSALAVGTPLEALATADSWRDFLTEAGRSYEKALHEWTDETEGLREAWEAIPEEGASPRDMALANAIRYQVITLCDITVIEWFANARFLPRYGFPINLQKLAVRQPIEGRERSAPDERFRLERSSLLALNEYVPGSHVLVGGRVAVSRGVLKHWTEDNIDRALGLQYLALECDNEHVYLDSNKDSSCPICHCPPAKTRSLLFPRHGYTTAAWESLERNVDLERVARGIVYPLGFAENRADELRTDDFGGLPGLCAVFHEDAELLIRNEGELGCGFALCTRCGYAESERKWGQGRVDLPEGFDKHASVLSVDAKESCWGRARTNAPVLRNRVLAARENTEMLKLLWPNFSQHETDVLYTLGRAMVKAGARLLELDERELELAEVRSIDDGMVIYDTAPGGAGHCLALFNNAADWLQETRSVLFVNQEHEQKCERACLECLLDFSSQHSAHRLKRREAARNFEQLFLSR
jgi:hypothetical protein